MAPTGWVALDVDQYNGDDDKLRALEATLGALPPSVVQRSGSGQGLHLVFRHPGGQLTGKLGGITIRSRAYIVVAPSSHVSGRRYEWIKAPGSVPVADLPAAWIAAMRPTNEGVDAWQESTPHWHESLATELRKKLRALGQRGTGGAATMKAIKLVHHDFGRSVDDGSEFLKEWNDGCGNPHDTRGLNRQIKRVANKFDAKDRDYPRGWRASALTDIYSEPITDNAQPGASATDDAHPGTFAAEVTATVLEVKAALAGRDRSGEVTPLFEPAAGLFDRDYPATTWLVEGLLTTGGVGVIGGEPKVSKTWTALELAVAVATGTKAFGAYGTGVPRRAHYFFAEDMARQVRNRLRALAASRGMSPTQVCERLQVQPRGRFLDITRDDDIALIVASVRKHGGTDLLVLDPLRDIHGGEEDKSDSMRDVMRRLRLLGELLDCTVVVNHHAVKSNPTNASRRKGQKLRGSGAIHGAVDAGLYLDNLVTDGCSVFAVTATSEVKGARSAGFFHLTLTITDDLAGEAVKAAWKVSRDTGKAADEVSLESPIVAALADALFQAPDQRRTVRDLRKKLGGGRGEVDSAIKWMLGQDLAALVRKGRKHCGYRLTPRGVAFAERGES
jgi:hypothetical protein